ncbi:hypothetical protein, partial [Pseudomonas aeruginosa]|uniref:hypothetical protein n=1 Tax=Pseudomonas aeruginosa TaxID=287 RepID=UPI001EE75D01
ETRGDSALSRHFFEKSTLPMAPGRLCCVTRISATQQKYLSLASHLRSSAGDYCQIDVDDIRV